MRIAMFTNLYYPHVGGIQRSIETFKNALESRGHEVLVVTPKVSGQPVDDPRVVEVPAVQNFNGSDFSVAVPIPGYLIEELNRFEPDLMHSHHPFLLGDTALRAAQQRDRPLVFTYHTMWEYYTHYTPSDSPAMQTFVKRMAAAYCDLCDHVIAPCESIAEILRGRDIQTPIGVIPTGIEAERFASGDGAAFRSKHQIPADAPVAGYIGRFGPEKNLPYLADALTLWLQADDARRCLLVGFGDVADDLRRAFDERNLSKRVHMPGKLSGQDLIDAYHALDVFAFSSKSETQGLVLAEAMAAGLPVVALNATGAREIVTNGENGRLLPADAEPQKFADALDELLTREDASRLQQAARERAAGYSVAATTDRLVDLYRDVMSRSRAARDEAHTVWHRTTQRLKAEWELWSGRVAAAASALQGNGNETPAK